MYKLVVRTAFDDFRLTSLTDFWRRVPALARKLRDMENRKLGSQGLTVSALSLGCMDMSFVYGTLDDDESIKTIHRALDLGVTFLDTAEIYGPYTNEKLVGRAIKGRRDGVVVATKFGFKFVDGERRGVDGSSANVKRVADESLQRLGIDVIDLYYQHRRDPGVPVEETVGAMAELVQAGKVRYLARAWVSDGCRRYVGARRRRFSEDESAVYG